MCDSVGNSQALVQAGKLRGLAITATTRSSAVPDVPTLAEAGVPGVVAHIWLGLLGPAKMPAPVVTRLNAEVARAMAQPGLRDRVLNGGNEPMVGPPEKFSKDIEEEGQEWLRVIRAKGIKAE
jgi:tripartite-type tricarboxylate transporter receptor subunit TctC